MYIYRNRISVYQKKYTIDTNNFWVEKTEKWKDVWADVSVKINNNNTATYQFVVKFFCDFPNNFNVTLNGTVFNIYKMPVTDPQKCWIKFFGKKVEGQEISE